ncbi:flagellar protein FlgN [Yoonia sp. I 8.24]|uniref:flagellar protein FlgN n=1 Tax=Yoonia sp. I 8.24 TaxID=1537229 RepID=UPI001EE1229E|nr:flagellar protein FlgN [Yoonia sp. I 8.24]MCG3269118.1 flagellar protein FlgN [Yoonia sp. I 8.24]
MHDSVVTSLFTTLEKERAALLSGKFHLLLALEETKSAQLQDLENRQPTTANLQAIRRGLSENQRLFAAAIAGIKSARNRIGALQNVRSGLHVYDESGAMATVAMHQPAIEKKA